MKLFNDFTGGAMNKDIETRLLPKSTYSDAKNIRITTPEDSNSFSVKLPLGTTALDSLTFGAAGPICIGSCADLYRKKLYWAVVTTTSNYCYVCEYDVTTDTASFVLQDNRGASTNALGWTTSSYVDMKVLNDNDNGKNFIVMADNENEPKFFEIDDAKSLTPHTFSEEAILLIKKPPLVTATVAGGTTATAGETNPIEDKMFVFSYRYRYTNGEISAMAPFSEVGFFPQDFTYVGDDGIFNGPINKFSDLDVTINTGGSDVVSIDVLYKQVGNSDTNVYIYKTYDKTAQSWSDNSSQTITFENKGIHRILPVSQPLRLYDNVPIKARSVEIINNRIVFGNYTEGYDIDIAPNNQLDITAGYATTTSVSGLTGYRSVKTNMSYDIAIAYLDGKGRMTTPLFSPTSTVFVSNSDSGGYNLLTATIGHQAPSWATNYVFFVRQSRVNFYNIATYNVYRTTSGSLYTYYFRIWEGDENKIQVGDFIYIKNKGFAAGPTGILNEALKVKVLTKEEQAANFLGGSENAGLYISFSSSVDLSVTTTATDYYVIETEGEETNSDIFYEVPYIYSISSRNHLGDGVSDTNQSYAVTDAVITLKFHNTFVWDDQDCCLEISSMVDSETKDQFIPYGRVSSPIENYSSIVRPASLTYGGVYQPTTGYNALNEFNLSEANYKDLDIAYGSIQKLYSKDTNLLVFQENKTHRVLYSKSILYNADGTGNITQSQEVLGQEIAYAGEYGIGTHPESFAFFGNRIYHYDKDRGAVLRLGIDGYSEISQKGMHDYFRSLSSQDLFVGGYDPYNDEYLLNVAPDSSPLTIAYKEGGGSFAGGWTSFYEYQPERLQSVGNRMYGIKNGQVYLHDNNATRNLFYGDQRTASITTVFADSPHDIKHFKSLNQECDNPWSVSFTTPFASGTIANTEFVLAEGEYYAYFRGNETSTLSVATEGIHTYNGLGTISSIASLTLTMGFVLPKSIAIGDTIYKYNSGPDTVTSIGTVQSYDIDAGTITLNTVTGLIVGDYILYGKEARVAGETIKGPFIELTLTNSATTDIELFALKLEAVKSFD